MPPRKRAKARPGEAQEKAGRDNGGGVRAAGASQTRIFQLLVLAALAGGLYLILLAGQPPLGVKVGEASPRDFSARVDFRCEDLEQTRLARDRARRNAPSAFRAAQEAFQQSSEELLLAVRDGPQGASWKLLAQQETETLPVKAVLLSVRQALEGNVEELGNALEVLASLPLVSPDDRERALGRPGAGVRIYGAGEEEPSSLSPDELVPLSASSTGFSRAFQEALAPLEPAGRDAAIKVFERLISPNVVYDPERTLTGEREAFESQAPIPKPIPKGTVFLARGTEVRSQHVLELEAERGQFLASAAGRHAYMQKAFGLAVLLLSILCAAVLYVVRFQKDLPQSRLKMFSVVLCTLAFIGLTRFFVVSGIPVLLTPLPLVVMALCLAYEQRFGFEVAVFYGLLAAISHPAARSEFIVLTLGGMTAALLSGQVRTRSTLIKAGIITGCLQWAVVWGMGLLQFMGDPGVGVFLNSIAAFGNGVLSGFLITGLLPAVERLFGVVTDIRLLEWSDPNQPLLQRLLLDAPGSYHHSMIVGSLAADAAETVGANPLLARLSAYFHDVGKLKKPDYFVENLKEGQRNPHEDLSPSMSSLIITSHPKDGAEMAARAGLPRQVCDVILQSHGSTVVKYFFGRAQQAGGEEGENAREETYRYRLPRPQSKEAAIVMLCDGVESATRSLESPSPTKIENLVRGLVIDRLNDGQLDESGLTLTDLSKIGKALARGLNAVFHNRIAYPGQDEEKLEAPEARQNADRAGKPAQ